MNCEHCDAMMVCHKQKDLPLGTAVRCHHCQAEQILPKLCPQCGKRIGVMGSGTQRIEEELLKKFDLLRQAQERDEPLMTRMDSDTMRTSKDYFEALDAFRQGRTRLLLGTQMIAKGLDFPNVRLVGVLSGDTALNMPDFRAAERTFQLISQVAGRAGRSLKRGMVVVQSFNPDDPSIKLAAEHRFKQFAQDEMALRRQTGLPPVGRMARIVCRNEDHEKAQQKAQELTDQLQRANEELGGVVAITGPDPCPLARKADFFRFQVELLAPDVKPLLSLMRRLRRSKLLLSDQWTAVDVDPIMMS
jgi:primosomal protein N' (replication factor Y)